MAESGQQSAFISIYHKRVPVTAEMKIELHRMNSTLRAKMRKERRCAQKDYLQCCGDCLSCYWRRKGIYVKGYLTQKLRGDVTMTEVTAAQFFVQSPAVMDAENQLAS